MLAEVKTLMLECFKESTWVSRFVLLNSNSKTRAPLLQHSFLDECF